MPLNPDEIEKAEAVLEAVRSEWLDRPGVNAVDLGFRWTAGQMTEEVSIRVHVAKKKGRDELEAGEIFPDAVDGVPVDVIQATYAPQTVVNAKPEMAVTGRGKRYSVIPLGVSVGCRYATAGTLGAKVFDSRNGDEMILSNWHVLAGRQNIEENLEIWQPGWIDGGTRQENIIAELSRWVIGPYDAAVARLTGARKVTTETVEGRRIEDSTNSSLGMRVWKSGRSTGLTEGFIDGIKMSIPLNYPGLGMRLLERVFRIVPRPGESELEMSIGGDSGAIWVDEESGKAVGLHFAGEIGDNPEHALAHDIDLILNHLEVQLPAQRKKVRSDPKQPPSKGRGTRRGRSFWLLLSEYLRKWLSINK